MNTLSLNLDDPIRDAITRIRFAPSSSNLLISSWDFSLRLYDVGSSKLRMESSGDDALLDCCFENERTCFSCGFDGSVNRYDLDSGIKFSVGSHDDSATCVEYSSETCQIVSAGWDRKINFWDARTTQSHGCLKTLVSEVEVESLALSDFNLMVAAGSSVDIIDLRSFKSFKHSVLTQGAKVKCVRPIINPEGFVVGSVEGRVILEYTSRSSSNDGYAFRCHPKDIDGKVHHATVNDIVFNPLVIGSFVTGDNDGYAIFWDARGKKRVFEMPRYPNSVASLSYSHDGLFLAVASGRACQEANELTLAPQIFIHEMGNYNLSSPFSGC